ncbi:IS3 family transposase [Mannheimia indoligenes]|uniref:IS3 family transposase n=1 Tax=Mannheimia indoligenes TaxID=3103145 RepID=UPI003D180197
MYPISTTEKRECLILPFIINRLKSEYIYSRTYRSIVELQAEIEDYVVYYNKCGLNLI